MDGTSDTFWDLPALLIGQSMAKLRWSHIFFGRTQPMGRLLSRPLPDCCNLGVELCHLQLRKYLHLPKSVTDLRIDQALSPAKWGNNGGHPTQRELGTLVWVRFSTFLGSCGRSCPKGWRRRGWNNWKVLFTFAVSSGNPVPINSSGWNSIWRQLEILDIGNG